MTIPMAINPAQLTAIDVHVHLETPKSNDADAAASKYFGDSGAPRDGAALAEYYRSRKMACVLFTVDERLTGGPTCRTKRSSSWRRPIRT